MGTLVFGVQIMVRGLRLYRVYVVCALGPEQTK